MKKAIFILLLALCTGTFTGLKAQCTAENLAFSAGENLSYKLYFNWKFIWVTVGSANMSIKSTNY